MTPSPTQRAARGRRHPIRTCAGCRAAESPERLVRCVLGPDGGVLPDLAGSAFGRGAWVHPDPACVAKAAPAGFSKSFKTAVRTRAPELQSALSEAALRRAGGLLTAARRARKLALGGSAVEEALKAGQAKLVVVATDARAAADIPLVADAIRAGRAVAWGTKDVLGELVGRSELAVVAVLDDGLAQVIARTIAMAHLPPSSGSVSASTEAR